MPRKTHTDRLTKRQRVRQGRKDESRAGREAHEKSRKRLYWS